MSAESVSARPSLAPPHLVIFDLDGTLVDTLEPTFHCFQEAVAPALGRRPTREEILERFGPADDEIVASWVGEAHAAGAVRRLYACYEHAFRETGPFPGMPELVHGLRSRGSRTAICTGRGRRSTDVLLESMNLSALFDRVVCGDEVVRPKPAPDGLLRVLEELGELPAQAVYVGDTLKDLEAARAAGITFLAALWGSPERDAMAARAELAASDPAEARRLLSID